jgi:hypothetical protein
MKSYTLLPCVHNADYIENGRKIYVNMEADIFFIGDKNWMSFKVLRALNALSCTLGDHPTIDPDKIPEFGLDLVRRIKNIAIDWELFRDMTEDEPAWLLLINLDQIIITVRNPKHGRGGLPPSYTHKMRDIEHGTITEHLADVALHWKNFCLHYLRVMQIDPDYAPPTFKVMDLSPPGTEDNSVDDVCHSVDVRVSIYVPLTQA